MIGVQRDDYETYEFVTFSLGCGLIYAVLLIVVWVWDRSRESRDSGENGTYFVNR